MKLIQGDCLDVLKTLPDNSVDAVVTDPPYGLKFMGKKWDYEVPSVETWREVMRVLKHGGHALVACGTRTQHRMALNIEDAGFEIRDVITWLYGSGFPKSLDVSKAIDKQAGAEREVIGKKSTYREPQAPNGWDCTKRAEFETAPSTEEAKEWQGWGTALKPACEFWTLARKPLSEKTVAANVLKWGTGAINVDGCRVEGVKRSPEFKAPTSKGLFNQSDNNNLVNWDSSQGRFPANLILDEQAAFMLDEQSGERKSGGKVSGKEPSKTGTANCYNEYERVPFIPHNDSGGASRFFYCAKASKSERNAGCESNNHPTVKPIKLMQYLCRLITPPKGIVLDPFMGSGSTGVAAKNEGFDFIGIEREKEYKEIAEKRIEAASNGNQNRM